MIKEDEYILKKFKQSIGTEKPLYYNERSEKNCNWEDVARLEISSQKMSDDLAHWGIVPRKTKIFVSPVFSEPIMQHYIRGYYDGDGGITVFDKRFKTPCWYNCYITGYEHNLNVIIEHLKKVGICGDFSRDLHRDYGENFGQIRFSNIEKKYLFLKYLYKNATIFFKRKKDIADLYFEAIANNYSKKQNIYNKFLTPSLGEKT